MTYITVPGAAAGPRARHAPPWRAARASHHPAELAAAMPLGPGRRPAVARQREEVRAVLDGADGRLLVITGPCSVHDPAAAAEYARWLAGQAAAYRGDLLLVVRAY